MMMDSRYVCRGGWDNRKPLLFMGGGIDRGTKFVNSINLCYNIYRKWKKCLW